MGLGLAGGTCACAVIHGTLQQCAESGLFDLAGLQAREPFLRLFVGYYKADGMALPLLVHCGYEGALGVR